METPISRAGSGEPQSYLVTSLGHLQRWGAHFFPKWFIPLSDHIYCEKMLLTLSPVWPSCGPFHSPHFLILVLALSSGTPQTSSPPNPVPGQLLGNVKAEDPFLE